MGKEPAGRLTEREASIAERVERGMSAGEIAADLGITEKAVHQYVHLILERMAKVRVRQEERVIRTEEELLAALREQARRAS